MWKEYIDYINDNPKGYWFKRKLYGWGWTPARPQGWLVIAGYIGLVLFFAFSIDKSSPTKELVFTFFLPLAFLTFTLLRICYKKGEPPKWMWGLPKTSKDSPC